MIKILYEDDAIIVVDKPAGRIVHPAPGHAIGALTEELVRHAPTMAGVGSVERPGVVHRLDLETSGVMIFAKTQRAYLQLRREFESHQSVRKTYLAVLHGAPHPPCGTLDGPLGRERLRAITHWRTLGRSGSLALVEFRIETGRLHQIRQHAAQLGCPVVGDRRYGDAVKDRRLRHPPQRQLLHAVELTLPHPISRELMTFTSPPPPELVYAR